MAGSSTIYDDIADTLFEVVLDRIWYQSNGMLYFCGDTLFLHQMAGQVSSMGLDHKLEDISNQDQLLQQSL